MDQEIAAGRNATLSGNSIRTGAEYIESLRGRKLNVYLFGELVDEPVDHPIIRPSINAVAETYDLAEEEPELATRHLARSPASASTASCRSPRASDDVVHAEPHAAPARPAHRHLLPALRRHGRHQLAVLGHLRHRSEHGTDYHERFIDFVKHMQRENFVIGGAMTDPKGDRSKAPHEQDDPDLFVRVVERRRRRRRAARRQGAPDRLHQLALAAGDAHHAPRRRRQDYAIVGAIPVDHPGITYIYGRQSCDTRALESGDIDAGNARFGGQEAMIIFDDVFVPYEPRVHGRRVRVRRHPGRALHRVPPPQLRLQDRASATC